MSERRYTMYRFLEIVANVLLGGKGSLDRLANIICGGDENSVTD
jgi:hypothetical protein